jgi:HEPN domain-containing protein
MDKDDVFCYWMESSENDYQAMRHLFEKGDYAWSLFIGHLVIEKLLKACYIQQVDISPPFIHDLNRLAEKSEILMNEDQKDTLDAISTFNLRARYDDYKMTFHNKCTRSFTEKWIREIEETRTWLKQKLQKQPSDTPNL